MLNMEARMYKAAFRNKDSAYIVNHIYEINSRRMTKMAKLMRTLFSESILDNEKV